MGDRLEELGGQSFDGAAFAEFDRAAEQLRATFVAEASRGGSGRWYLALSRSVPLPELARETEG